MERLPPPGVVDAGVGVATFAAVFGYGIGTGVGNGAGATGRCGGVTPKDAGDASDDSAPVRAPRTCESDGSPAGAGGVIKVGGTGAASGAASCADAADGTAD